MGPDTVGNRSGSARLELAAVAVLIAASVGVQWFVVATRRIPINSDQAIVGLMAKHILEGRGHPVFYYGVAYGGSLEPHYVAGVFAVLGVSPASYRVAMAGLVCALIVGVFLFTRKTFGRTAALAALAYLAVPPFFFLYKGLTSDGAYDSVALAALATLAAALAIDRRLEENRGRRCLFVLLGLAAGMGWWATPVTLSVSASAIGWLFLRRRARPTAMDAVFGCAGALAGSFPWWFWNVRHGWGSLRAPELGVAGFLGAARNLAALFWTSLPALEGGIVATPDIRFVRETFPLSRVLSLAALVLILGCAAGPELRKDRRLRLFWISLAALFLAAAFSKRLLPSEPRYLVAYYVFAAPMIGMVLAASRGRRRAASVAAAGALFVLHAASIGAARVNDVLDEGEVTGSLEPLIRFLTESGIRSAYADYWTAYRLSFESGERVVATPVPGEELVRYVPDLARVQRDLSPAIVLLEARDACFEAYLRESGISHRRSQVGPFGVFSGIEGKPLEILRRGWGLPLPSDAYRAGWRVGPQPATMKAGASQPVKVDVWNQGPCRWPVSVHMGYHWWPVSAGIAPVYEGPRGILSGAVAPGERATFEVELMAPPSAGRYRLEYDLVHENIAWFADKGSRTASVEVEVLGRSPGGGARGGP